MPPFDFEPETWFRVIDVAAIVTNGLLGGAVARAHRFDIVGFIIFSVITAMGGGIIRDVLLDTGFPVALTDSYYWVAALAAGDCPGCGDGCGRWSSARHYGQPYSGDPGWEPALCHGGFCGGF